MQRVGFLIKVKPHKLAEYKKLHNPIWPELAAVLKDAGMRNYSLWLRPDGLEFGYLECDDWSAVRAKLATSEVHARWQTMMRDYLDTTTDAAQGGQPIEMLEQVFMLE
jgi:L-rhamnose mutarotase